MLIADVSEPSISSIFIGRWMKYYFIHLPMKMELIEGSETSAISIVTPGNCPKENILHCSYFIQRIEFSRCPEYKLNFFYVSRTARKVERAGLYHTHTSDCFGF